MIRASRRRRLRPLATSWAIAGLLIGIAAPASRSDDAPVAVGWTFDDGSVVGWAPWFGAGTVAAVATGGRTGPGALRANTNATGQTDAVTSGQTYEVTAYMKTLAPAKSRGAEVQVYDVANNAVTLPLAFTDEAGGWSKATGRITLPAQTRVVVLGFDAGGVSFLLDDVSLTPASPLPPAANPTTAVPTVSRPVATTARPSTRTTKKRRAARPRPPVR